MDTLAKSRVDQAIGEKPKKNIRPGIANRGHARAAALTPERRKAIARRAALARWFNRSEPSEVE
jgi:hypothetical protein